MEKLKAAIFGRLFKKVWEAWRGGIEATIVPGCGGIVFLGDSITHNGRWDLIFPHAATRNLGINGERTDQLLSRLETVIAIAPSKIFILIGTNDLGTGIAPETIAANLAQLLDRLAAALPACRIHLQTLMPRARKYAPRIQALNARYAQLAAGRGITLVDLYPVFDDGSGKIRDALTYDDLHLNGAGYVAWRKVLEPYVVSGG